MSTSPIQHCAASADAVPALAACPAPSVVPPRSVLSKRGALTLSHHQPASLCLACHHLVSHHLACHHVAGVTLPARSTTCTWMPGNQTHQRHLTNLAPNMTILKQLADRFLIRDSE